jgi:hypothetical protein
MIHTLLFRRIFLIIGLSALALMVVLVTMKPTIVDVLQSNALSNSPQLGGPFRLTSLSIGWTVARGSSHS